MRKYETKTVTKTVEIKDLVERSCDLCGRLAKNDEWGSSVYEIAETEVSVTVQLRTGESYPSGGRAQETEVDICPPCFRDRLIPWLESQGARPRVTDSDW